jgi:uncharacterized protein (DUF1501 family)
MALLAAAPTVPTFLNNTLLAVTQPTGEALTQQASGTDGKILVVVQMSGGNDGLNTVCPWADDIYQRERPGLAIGADKALKINDYLGLHPNLAPIKSMFDDGKMAIVQGVGYPNPNRSHFRAMDIWNTAEPEKEVIRDGWLGRYFDNQCDGTPQPDVGVSIGETLPIAMQGSKTRPLSFDRPENYRYNGADGKRYQQLNQPAETVNAKPGTAASQLEFLTRTAMDAQLSSDRILKVTKAHNPVGINYPGGNFGNGLRTIAAMIRGGLPTRVYYVSLGGFDTHANQLGRHERLMQEFASGVSAFWDDMMMSFSEFGRRLAKNASGGTDHGAAAPMFLFGPSVQDQGIIGRHPSLRDLDAGDLKYGVDFRNVYASVLETWLDAKSAPILGGNYRPLPIIKA